MKNERNELSLFNDGEFGMFTPFFDDIFRVPSLKREQREFNRMMKTDVKETDKSYELEVEMPGYDKKDINMDIKNGYLNISASKQENNDEQDKKGNYIRRERRYGSISRSFYVGDEIKEQDINASLSNGVLNIEVPKKQLQNEEHKKIEIK